MEKAVNIQFQNQKLFGILHQPGSVERIETVVMMVVGGPQTRVGSHRLYVQLARYLENRNIAVLRFDYAGTGDSGATFKGFEEAGPSIEAAIDFLYSEFAALKSLIIWSLCDGAAASAMYAPRDVERINAMILANPFVETEEGQAKTILKHYYKNRLLERDFWQKLLTLNFDIKKSLASFFDLKRQAGDPQNGQGNASTHAALLPTRVLNGLMAYARPMHFLISSNDITGMEFMDHFKANAGLVKLTKTGIATVDYIAEADHTFSNSAIKSDVFEKTAKAIDRFRQTEANSHLRK